MSTLLVIFSVPFRREICVTGSSSRHGLDIWIAFFACELKFLMSWLVFRGLRVNSDFHECVFRFCQLRGTGKTVWYLSGRLLGPPPTSIYELEPPGILMFDLLMSINSNRLWRVCASSKLMSFGPPTLKLFGRSMKELSRWSRCSIWSDSVSVNDSHCSDSYLSKSSFGSNISPQFVIRYSVTTAWTPTPRRAATPGQK